MTPQPRHRAPARRRAVLIAAAAVALTAAGSVPAALAAQRGSAAPHPKAAANLALGRPVTGSAACRSDEGAGKAVNGTTSGLRDKWCSAAAVKTLRVDLGSPTALTSITVRHAGSGGEQATYNTRDFDVQVSADGTVFTTVASIRGNTANVTTHATTAQARYVRLSVVRAEQVANPGVARIYEFEVYGTPAAPDPVPSPSRPGTPTPSASPSPAASPVPPPSPSASPKPAPVPPPSASCFPYPERDTSQAPHPVITYAPGVQPLDAVHLAAATAMWVNEWPGAWQRFSVPGDPWLGVTKVIVTNDTSATFGTGTLEIPRQDIVGGVDKQDFGSWMHETAHGIQMHYPDSGVPALYAEGIPDFVRFVAHKEDPQWKIVSLADTDAEYFTEQRGWDGGYRISARFLLWVTQHYDKSGAKYDFVHGLNVGASTANPDWQGLFTKLTGKSFHQLFTEYAADRVINPHC
ncbi:MAG: hypothetical protein QOD41_3580 [Cryptosporangiaceae bacterium]|nr:hypothetical protein [Cryptosporangiaceae bacterium]